MLVFIFLAFLITCLTVDAVIQYKKHREAAINQAASSSYNIFNEDAISVPGGLYFDKSHTWAFMDTNGYVKIGINDFIQHATGLLTRVKLRQAGEMIKRGEAFISIIQKGKQLNIYSPLTGIIKTENQQLYKKPSLINSSPYADGWVYKIEPENWLKETQFMKMAGKAKEWLKNEFSRLKDTIAFIRGNSLEFAQLTLQDGGAIKDGFLTELGPEIWEEFQTKFIDKGD